jgi:hypothetical protein
MNEQNTTKVADVLSYAQPFDTCILIALHALQCARRYAPCTQPEVSLWNAIRACENALLVNESPIKKTD